jgi:hypothetical protein
MKRILLVVVLGVFGALATAACGGDQKKADAPAGGSSAPAADSASAAAPAASAS